MEEEKPRKVLIIKTGYSEFLDHRFDLKSSLGDVLRTTPILHAFKGDYITWATDERALPLLEENLFINRLMALNWITEKQLRKEHFDVLVNLEKHPGIGVLASEIDALQKYGFGTKMESKGLVSAAYDKGSEALSISLTPQLKKDNAKPIQEILFGVVGKKWNGEEYVLGYAPKTEETDLIALNTNVGGKWPTKAWPDNYWDDLENLLLKENFKVTRQDNQDASVLRDLNKYMDWINSSRVIISNDSLGMHLGIAMRKKVVGLFGPTPISEVYFYGRGVGLQPDNKYGCIPCMSPKCPPYGDTCLKLIHPEIVKDAAISLLRSN